MAITDTWLKANNNKEHGSVFEKSDRDGLSARVSAKGKITFQLRFRLAGKQQRSDVGTYPLMSLKEAREKALYYRSELEKGNDPRIVKRVAIAKNMEILTVESLYRRFSESYCTDKKKNYKDILRSFEIHVFPKLGDLPPDRIDVDQWMGLFESIKKATPATAANLLSNTKQMLAWGVRRKLIGKNELSGINAKADLGVINISGERSLSDDEIRMLFDALVNSGIAHKNKLFIQLCLFYGCRGGELRKSEKKHFDFDKMIWTVPPENHKTGKSTGRPLIRPISYRTKKLFEECISVSAGGVFLLNNSRSDKPMSSASPMALPGIIMQWLRKNRSYNMGHWSIHDLRKTARTNFSTLTEPHIAEIMLGHNLPGEWRTYDMHKYLDEQRACLDKWMDRIEVILTNKE